MDTILFNFTFTKIFNAVKRKIFVIIITTLIGALGAGAYAYKTSTTTYEAQISLYVVSNPSALNDSSLGVSQNEFTMAKTLVPSYMLVLKSDTVISTIIENLGLSYTVSQVQNMITSNAVSDTAVFYVKVYSEDPYIAMEIANGIAEVAPETIARVVKSGGVQVIDRATLPTTPYNKTNFLKFVIIGAAGGFALSFILVVLIALLDSTIRKKSDIEKTFSIPVVGEIPEIKAPSKKEEAKKLLDNDSPFALREAYSGLRTNIMFLAKDEKCPVFAVTSATQGDGKTMNSVNIAAGFARLGKKVLLIDSDLRNPSVAKFLGMKSPKEGLSQYLAGFTKVLEPVETKIENLDAVLTGAIPPNPAELLATKKFAEMIELFKESYDFIFIDTPPVGVVSDAVAFSDYLNGYIIVIRAQVSRLTDERRIVKMLEQVDANICGLVYNAVELKSSHYKKYNKYYDYRYEK